MAVECCFTLYDAQFGSDPGCTYPNPPICIDPSSPAIDKNQDGTVDVEELTENVCKLKCPVGPENYPFYGPAFHKPGSEAGISLQSPYYGCMPLSGQILTGEPPCDPSSATHLQPFPQADVSPTHEGTLVAGAPGSHSDVTINGTTIAVDYAGSLELYLDDCVSTRPYVQCELGLRYFRLDLVGSPVFGDYRVDEATLTLATPQSTTIDFLCDRVQCDGSFQLSDSTGTAIEANLNWSQTNVSTGTPGGGGLLLSNGSGGLGGITSIGGRLLLDVSLSEGTLVLTGSGADAFGGDIASTSFQLEGTIGRPIP